MKQPWLVLTGCLAAMAGIGACWVLLVEAAARALEQLVGVNDADRP